jgi:phage terminase large subunit-like protein
LIENGFVYIPETAPWLDKYLHELTVFPKGKHDYRQLAEEAEQRRKAQPIRPQ